VAKVDAQNRLDVGDGSGPMTVDGTVTAQRAPTAAFFHSPLRNVSTSTCTPIVTPPGTKALIIRGIRVDTYTDPSPGPSQFVAIYQTSDCTRVVAEVNPPSVGQTVVPFDPGLGVPNGASLSANVGGSVAAEVFVDGYTVPGS
jgi:hypothetical protein